MANNGCRGLAWVSLGVLPLLAFLRIDSRWDPQHPGFNKTLLTDQAELQSLIPKDAIVIAGPDNSAHIWLYYLDRKGYTFDNRGLTAWALNRWEKWVPLIWLWKILLQIHTRDPNLTQFLNEWATLRYFPWIISPIESLAVEPTL